MKKKKNKLKNLLKIGTLLFGVSLLLWNCQENEILIEQSITDENQQIEQFQNSFDTDNFTKTLKHEYQVDWSTQKKQYSKQLESYFYEFPIDYLDKFNPDIVNKVRRKDTILNIKLLLLNLKQNQININFT
jgi:hypothetical protein